MAATCGHGHRLLGSPGSREKGGSKPQTSSCCLDTIRTAGVWGAQTDGVGRAALAVSPTPAQRMLRTRSSCSMGARQPRGHSSPPCSKPCVQPRLLWARSPFKADSVLRWPRAVPTVPLPGSPTCCPPHLLPSVLHPHFYLQRGKPRGRTRGWQSLGRSLTAWPGRCSLCQGWLGAAREAARLGAGQGSCCLGCVARRRSSHPRSKPTVLEARYPPWGPGAWHLPASASGAAQQALGLGRSLSC